MVALKASAPFKDEMFESMTSHMARFLGKGLRQPALNFKGTLVVAHLLGYVGVP